MADTLTPGVDSTAANPLPSMTDNISAASANAIPPPSNDTASENLAALLATFERQCVEAKAKISSAQKAGAEATAAHDACAATLKELIAAIEVEAG